MKKSGLVFTMTQVFLSFKLLENHLKKALVLVLLVKTFPSNRRNEPFFLFNIRYTLFLVSIDNETDCPIFFGKITDTLPGMCQAKFCNSSFIQTRL